MKEVKSRAKRRKIQLLILPTVEPEDAGSPQAILAYFLLPVIGQSSVLRRPTGQGLAARRELLRARRLARILFPLDPACVQSG